MERIEQRREDGWRRSFEGKYRGTPLNQPSAMINDLLIPLRDVQISSPSNSRTDPRTILAPTRFSQTMERAPPLNGSAPSTEIRVI